MTQLSTAQFAADLAACIADLPASCTSPQFIAGTKSCALSELSVESTLMLAGSLDVRHFELFMLISDCSAVPAVTNRVAITNQGEVSATNYEVVNWNKSQDGIAYRIIVKADHRN